MPTPEEPDPYKSYDAIWQNMARENTLINDRNQWAIVLSAGILATEAALLQAIHDAGQSPEDHLFFGLFLFLMFTLSSLAAYFCQRSANGVMAAQNQLDYLKREYAKWKHPDVDGSYFELKLRLPRPFGNPYDHYRGNATAVTFPKVMFAVWLILLILQFGGAVVYVSDGLKGLSKAIHDGEKRDFGSSKQEPASADSQARATSATVAPAAPSPPESPVEMQRRRRR